MCKDCEITSEPLQAETVRHLLDCRPCCGECFKGKYCFLPREGKKDVNAKMILPGKCDCGLGHLKTKPQPTEIKDDYIAMLCEGDRTACYAGSASCGDPTLVALVKVCKVCNGKTDTEMLGMRGYGAGGIRVRTTLTMGAGKSFPFANLCRVEGFKCHHCERDFRRGEVVWWACKWCGEECIEGFHSQMGETVAP